MPTVFDEDKKSYDTSCIYEVSQELSNANYSGLIVIKSTVEPQTTDKLCDAFPKLKFVHNPEF